MAGRCIEGEDFSFCGLLFNTETCEARYEYERFNGSKAVDDLTVEVAVQPRITMGIKSKTFVTPRCSKITLEGREGEGGIMGRGIGMKTMRGRRMRWGTTRLGNLYCQATTK